MHLQFKELFYVQTTTNSTVDYEILTKSECNYIKIMIRRFTQIIETLKGLRVFQKMLSHSYLANEPVTMFEISFSLIEVYRL